MKRYFLLMAVMLAAMSASSQTARHFTINLSDDGEAQLYCYLPQHPSGRAVVACPGGAYGGLAFDSEGTDWAPYFNARGTAFCVLKYRMPKGNPEIPVADAYKAMETVRDSAQALGVNPYDVGIMGSSAGGHLAATVSTKAPYSARPNFAILVYPVITMQERWSHAGSVRRFLGDKKGDEKTVGYWSAENHVNHYATPPAVVFLSNDDQIVPPVTNAVAYYSAMRRAGLDCTMHIYPTGGHGYGFATWFKHREQMLGELDNWLNNLKAPRQDAIRVACIGNSITRGSCIDMGSEMSYPAQLQGLLGDNYNVRNFGMPGYTCVVRGDYPYQQTECWQMAQDFLPNIVVVKLGTNDVRPNNWVFAADYEHDLQLMVDRLKALPSKPRILLAYPIRLFTDKGGLRDSNLTDAVMPAIDRVARRNQLEVVDLHSVIQDEKYMTADGIHPNHNGALLIARAVAEAIRK